jgi:hypothetical protein
MAKAELSLEVFGHMARLTQRLQESSQFMSSALISYQKLEKLNEEDLVEHLGTTPAMLVRLAICRRPNCDSEQFSYQLRKIADYTNINVERLATLLRQVESLEGFCSTPDIVGLQKSFLAAARDQIKGEDEHSLSSETDREAE